MDVKVHARHHLQLDLRNALAADAFQVHYQPFYNLRTRRIATCEALLRWPHPERGMVPSEVTRLWLDQLQDLGVRISLDDFGTGYSSLSYLHSSPLNKVKIDRSFLQGLQASSRSLSLLCGVARLSAELDLAVTVEGVETREQLALIAREREVQGFYIGRAVPEEQIRSLLFSPLSQMDRVA